MFFAVNISLRCITRSDFKNEETAKSYYFCDFYAYSEMRRSKHHFMFMKGVSVSKKVRNLCCKLSIFNIAETNGQDVYNMYSLKSH